MGGRTLDVALRDSLGLLMAKQHKRLKALGEKWIRPIGLGWWDIETYYCDTRKQYRLATGHDPLISAATCVTDWRYRTAALYFNCRLWKTLSDAEAEKAFVHELMHIFLDELMHCQDDRQDHLERVATTLANALVWARKAGI